LDYLTAVRRLGLEPEFVSWAFDKEWDQFVLIVVTAFFDHAGPLAVSGMLFRAYEAAATPESVNPFIIRLHSPNHKIYRKLLPLLAKRNLVGDVVPDHGRPIPSDWNKDAPVQIDSDGLLIHPDWTYKFAKTKSSPETVARSWRHFSHNIEKLAA